MATGAAASRAVVLAASLVLASFTLSAPAFAQVVNPADEVEEDTQGPITISANVAIASEYRFRGVDLSGGEIAVQGGFDLATNSGFYVGTWASSLDETTVGPELFRAFHTVRRAIHGAKPGLTKLIAACCTELAGEARGRCGAGHN